MGLDALGDAYWIEDYGKRLITAAMGIDNATVKEVIKDHALWPLFHKDADKALICALEKSTPQNYEQMAEVLVKHTKFTESLSYQGLVQAKDYVISVGNDLMKDMISQSLDARREHIRSVGLMAYLKEIKKKTVSNASGDAVMLGTLGDAVAFAVDMSDVSGLMELARKNIHDDVLDEKTFDFVRNRLKKGEPKTREMMEFVVEVMTERKLIYGTFSEIKRSNPKIHEQIKKTRDRLVAHS